MGKEKKYKMYSANKQNKNTMQAKAQIKEKKEKS